MSNKTNYGTLNGNLQIWKIKENKTDKIMIYADAQGLKSFGEILIKLSELDQKVLQGLPRGEREHTHIYPSMHLSDGSLETIIGRLDAKITGKFPDSFKGKRRRNKRPTKKQNQKPRSNKTLQHDE